MKFSIGTLMVKIRELNKFGFASNGQRCLISLAGERLYGCDVCGKHFATNEYLKCHKRCHMGAKPYKCDACGKTFGLRASLAQHSNIHAGL